MCAASASSARAWPACHASVADVAVSRSSAVVRAADHAPSGCSPASCASTAASRSTNSASRPSRAVSPGSTAAGRAVPSHVCSSPAIATPSSSRSSPAAQVFCPNDSSLKGRRWAASRPQRTPEPTASSRSRSRSPSSSPKRVRTGSAASRSRTCDAVSRASASSNSRATTSSRGLTWRSARSASRTGRAWAGWAPGPKLAEISGAKVSMSGHITRTSRASSVGSASNSPSTTSRSTSTWRSGPWHACTWTLRSPGSGTKLPSGDRSSRSVALQPAQQRGGRIRARVVLVVRVRQRGGQTHLHLAHIAAEGGEQRVLGRRGARIGVARRHTAGPHLRPERRGGVRQPEVDLPVHPERREHRQLLGREPGGAEQRQAFRERYGLGIGPAGPRRPPRPARWDPGR